MKTNTQHILTVMKIIAWLAFVGFSIQCAAQITALIVGFVKPEFGPNLYQVDENWFKLKEESDIIFICIMSIIIAISAFKANVWYTVIKLFDSLNLDNPFTIEVAKKLEGIAWQLLVIWLAGAIGTGYLKSVQKFQELDFLYLGNEGEYLFAAGIIYIISQIFKRGVELQEENELTV